ncbi:uncharacterized protein LOC144372544 isoform X2 [Ictidomys tridecemlineatus]
MEACTSPMTSSLNSWSILWKTFPLWMNTNHARRFTPERSPEASVTKLGRAVYLRKPVLLPNGLQMAAHLVPGSRQRQLDRAQMTSKAEMLSYL